MITELEVEFVLVLKHSKRTAPVVALSLGVSYGDLTTGSKAKSNSEATSKAGTNSMATSKKVQVIVDGKLGGHPLTR